MKQFFVSYWFNVLIAIIAAFFAIMQEVWIGTDINTIGAIGFGTVAGFCLSICAEIIKMLPKITFWNWKHVVFGTIGGLIASIITGVLFV